MLTGKPKNNKKVDICPPPPASENCQTFFYCFPLVIITIMNYEITVCHTPGNGSKWLVPELVITWPDADLWLVESDHMTWMLASDWCLNWCKKVWLFATTSMTCLFLITIADFTSAWTHLLHNLCAKMTFIINMFYKWTSASRCFNVRTKVCLISKAGWTII